VIEYCATAHSSSISLLLNDWSIFLFKILNSRCDFDLFKDTLKIGLGEGKLNLKPFLFTYVPEKKMFFVK
jgi:hypothetical protein